MTNIMGEEMLMSECMEDGTQHIMIHKVPQWQLSNDITNAADLVTSCSLKSDYISGNSSNRSLLLNASQQKQPGQQEELCLDVSNESLKMDLVVLNVDYLVPQQSMTVDDLPLDRLVDTIMTYSCRLCMFVAADVSQLLQHFSTEHCLELPEVVLGAVPSQPTQSVAEQDQDNSELDNIFICGCCNSNFSSLDDCKQHMSQEHKSSAHKDGSGTSAKKLEVQKKPSVPIKERKFRCIVPRCFRKFSTEDRLQLHTSCHASLDGKSREFQCSKCDQRLERWNQCALHLWYTHYLDADLLSCPTCEHYKTVTQFKLSLHMKVHSDLKPYVCTVCDKGFKQSSQLRNHYVSHIDKNLSEPDLPRWYTSQRCPICHKTLSDSKCLKNHMKNVHSKLRPYVCQVCGHASAGKFMLRMHMRQHTGDKPYKCTQENCDFRTGDHNSLRRHMMRHSGKRPYACPHCSYSAIQSSAYKVHLRTRHPEAPELYICPLCPYHTVSAENLAHHEVDHKHGLVTAKRNRSTEDGDCEVFPGNVAAAHLIYRCFNPDTSVRGTTMKASLTGSQTSPDGSTQTIMIQIPAPGTDDDDSSHCFLEEEDGSLAVDTGGITIPADPDPPQDVNSSSVFPVFNTRVTDVSQATTV